MTQTKSFIITGAASGIGAAVAQKLAGTGVELTLHTRRNLERLEKVAEKCRVLGAEVETVLGDLAEPGTGTAIVRAHQSRFRRLGALVANAGFPTLTGFEEMSLSEVAYAFHGNSQSFFELAQAAHPFLTETSEARIVAVSSFTAHVFRTDMPQFPASSASKGAVEIAVRSLSLALAKDGITVNCVVPGYIEKDAGTSESLSNDVLNNIKDKIPLARLGKPEDVAHMICFLLGAEAGYVSGQIIHVNGGLI